MDVLDPAWRQLRLARYAGLVACATGGLVGTAALIGWALDLPVLYSSPWDDAVTTPWTAIGFLLLTASVAVDVLLAASVDVDVLNPGRSTAATAAACAAAGGALVVGAVSLVEYATGWSSGAEPIFFGESLAGLDFTNPGRPSVQTATTLALLGTATVFVLLSPRRTAPVVFAVATGLALPALGLIGHLFNLESLFDSRAFGSPGMSLPTGVMGISAAGALFTTELGPPLVGLANERGAGSHIVRVLLPAAFFVPLVLAASAHATQAGSEAGAAVASIVAALAIAVLTTIVWRTATSASVVDAQQRELVEQIPAPSFIVTDGTIAFANRAAATTWGATAASDLSGRSDVDVLGISLDAIGAAEHAAGLDEHPELIDIEASTVTVDGGDLVIELTPQAIVWDRESSLLVVARDVTARNAAHRTLTQANERLATDLEEREEWLRIYGGVVESSPDSVIATDLDGALIAWNGAAERVAAAVGRGPLRAGTHIAAISSDPERVAALLGAVVRGEPFADVLVNAPTPGGGVRHLSLSVSPVRGADGTVVAVAWVSRDITERYEADERFRTVVEAVSGAVVLVDGHGAIHLVNAEAEKMFDYTRDELIGRPVEMLVPESARRAHVVHREEFAATSRTRPMGSGLATFGRRADGSEFPVDVGLSPTVQDGERMVVAMITDISERVAAREALERHAAALGRAHDELAQFAYVASHDLQEPLRMVIAYTGMIEERYGDSFDERGRRYFDHVLSGAHRMQALIGDLLEYTRLEAQRAQHGRVDTDDVVRRVLSRHDETIRAHGAIVTVDALPSVLGQADEIERVFTQLLDNALKFRGEDAPRVHIGAVPTDGAYEFTVADNGIGIDVADPDRIFHMFQRLHARGDYEGTGVGLALVKRIVERHGGTVWYESRRGEGTTFRFTLPVSSAESRT
ncbi:MAG: PAS domain S-box protein [Actinomycetota bacterium]|nr:PAS domain S-box protein [Actinomycetota bacterium]